MRKQFLLLVLLLPLFSCSSSVLSIGEVRIKGSNTMLPLVTKLAQEYMKENKDVLIYTEGGGTELGIKALIENQIQICTASRNLEPEETKLLADHFRSIGISTFIARDAIRVFVNKKNQIDDLTMEQLNKIFIGEITNWKELGGFDKPILPIVRNEVSGTAAHFHIRVLQGQNFSKSVITKSRVEDIIKNVEENENAIGFSGLGYQWDCKLLSIEGIYPTEENIKNMSYPLSRYLHFFTISTPTGIIKDFIDWVLGSKGQRIVKEFGFVSLYDFAY